jgi:hypothetical protein
MGTPQGLIARVGTAATASAVSSAVYAGLTSTGDFTASLVGRGIGIGGVLLGSGADYLVGHGLGNSFRVLGFIGENSVRPLLSSGTRTLALGASVVAGTMTHLALPILLEMPTYIVTTGKYLFRVSKDSAERLLPARYIPTPADSDAVVEAFAASPRIQDLIRLLPIAALPGQGTGVSPLQAAEAVAAHPWQLLESESESESDEESETPHPTPAADA